MKEYRLAKGWAIFMYIAAPLIIGLFSWLLIMPFVSGKENDFKNLWIICPMSLGMIGVMVLGLIDTIKGKFVIDKDKIYSVGALSTRQLFFNEIKGYRVTDKYIFIESNIKEKKKIKVSTYFDNKDEIIEWLFSHYTDLDLKDVIQEKKEILSNEEFGWNTEEREEKLSKARKTAKILNWTGGLVGAWTLFLAKPYEYAIIASMTVPIISIIALKFYSGLIRIDERKSSAYPSIIFAIMYPSIGLLLRAMLDYDIFEYSKVWTPSILVASVFIAFMLIGNKEFKLKKAQDYLSILGIALIVFAYGYGSVITLNCMYDKSEPEIFNAKILDKRISSGKHTTYYFKLTPWGQQKEVDEVHVSKSLYNRLDKDGEVNIYFKKGKFDIPWFVLTE
jgi:hypothetical protein